LAPHPVALWVVLFAFGGTGGVMDVAVNEQAVLVEREARQPLLSSFHAAFSIGGLVGALTGAGAASLPGVSPFHHFLIASVIFGGAVVLISPHLVPVKEESAENQPVFRLPERALWTLGAVAFCSALGEGTMANWSAVYLVQVLKSDAAFAALGYGAFSLTMTVGRLVGDPLAKRWQPTRLVRAGGLAATAGFLLAVTAAEPLVVLLGFAAVGLGLSNIIPLSFSAAGNHPEIPTSAGIAGVATIGYAGLLAGPPLVGLITEWTSLRVALSLVTVLVGTLILTGRAVSSTE
jgi:fucose permease